MTHTKYCLCSDPDYCLRGAHAEYRRLAIAFRKVSGAPLPTDHREGSDVTHGVVVSKSDTMAT